MHLWNAIEVDERGYITVVSTKADGKRFRARYMPGDDLTDAPAIVQAAIADIWTDEVLAAEEARQQEAREQAAKEAEANEAERLAREEQEAAKAAAEDAEVDRRATVLAEAMVKKAGK